MTPLLNSDPTYLLKTTRNCCWNSKRMLWVSFTCIVHVSVDTCMYVSHVFYITCSVKGSLVRPGRSLREGPQVWSEATGLRLVPKLQFEHIYLLSFSKMRIDLAAQVRSTCTRLHVPVHLCCIVHNMNIRVPAHLYM